MVHTENQVGRLVEIRAHARPTPEQMDQDRDLLGAIRARHRGQRLCVVADLRHASLLPPDQAGRFVEQLRRESGWVERAALLLAPTSNTLGLQMDRVLREANSAEHHRLFVDAAQLQAWMNPVLTPAEAERLAGFLRA